METTITSSYENEILVVLTRNETSYENKYKILDNWLQGSLIYKGTFTYTSRIFVFAVYDVSFAMVYTTNKYIDIRIDMLPYQCALWE